MPARQDNSARVVLVNEKDLELGTAEKLEAHRKGLMHRAFSIFILRMTSAQNIDVLLQQRALTKYHSPGLWTNSCCSHPGPQENLLSAAKKRLKEELNLEVAVLKNVGQFHYIAHFENGLIENELDHVLIGWYQNEVFSANPKEIQAYRWVTLSELRKELRERPQAFTPWLERALGVVEKSIAGRPSLPAP